MRVQQSFPFRQFLAVHSKGGMNRACAVVRRNRSTWNVRLIQRRTANEEQQYMLGGNIERAKTQVFNERPKTQHALIKPLRSFQIVDVKRRLLQITKLRHQSM